MSNKPNALAEREADALSAKGSFRTRAIGIARRLWNAHSLQQQRDNKPCFTGEIDYLDPFPKRSLINWKSDFFALRRRRKA